MVILLGVLSAICSLSAIVGVLSAVILFLSAIIGTLSAVFPFLSAIIGILSSISLLYQRYYL
ncbi:hypothetical protein [Lysinibacillus sp. NPDC096212]|uniref:hypothetical protein n=1 Tax=unclassified Lysinibacillus TaxID=2636778 RepID=UPI0038249BF6